MEHCSILTSSVVLLALLTACTGEIGGESMTPPITTIGPAEPPDYSSAPPAAEPLRRLTSREYAAAASDAFGLDETRVRAATNAFSADGHTGHFAANPAGTVTTSDISRLLSAAEELSAEVAAAVLCEDRMCRLDTVVDWVIRAYRRPIEEEELQRFTSLLDGEEDPLNGLRAAAAAILMSPNFLYRIEVPSDSGFVDAHAYAARLASFLWRSIPDDALREDAVEGRLDTQEGRQVAVRRMMDDRRFDDMLFDFHYEWLGLFGNDHIGPFAQLIKDPGVYPEFTPELRSAMVDGLRDFVAYTFSEEPDSQLGALLAAPLIFGDEQVLSRVGPGEVFVETSERAGILGQPAVLAAYGASNQSDPIRRGLLVLEHFFCVKLAPPPMLDSNGEPIAALPLDDSLSRREQLRLHAEDPCTGGCHVRIDPLGLAFEHFDGIGDYRSEDAGEPVDASGTVHGTDVDDDIDGLAELSQLLATSSQVRSCIAENWLTFAVSRGLEDGDQLLLQDLAQSLEAAGSLREMLVQIAASDVFRRGPIEGATEETP